MKLIVMALVAVAGSFALRPRNARSSGHARRHNASEHKDLIGRTSIKSVSSRNQRFFINGFRERSQIRRRRDFYDYLTLTTATFAALGAAVAAWFTWDQATIARNQQIISLRAYVSPDVAPAPGLDERGLPTLSLTLSNMGQTPAYRLVSHTSMVLNGKNSYQSPEQNRVQGDCSFITDFNTTGVELGKNPTTERIGVNRNLNNQSIHDYANGEYSILLNVLICYRDVFGITRHIEFCRKWFPGWPRTVQCENFRDQHD